MLDESILGAAYRAWTDSGLCALLARLWRLLSRLAKDSLLLGLLFGQSRGDALYAESLPGRAFHGLTAGLLRLSDAEILQEKAKQLKRSENAVVIKAQKLGLGAFLNSGDYDLGISDNQFVSDGKGGFLPQGEIGEVVIRGEIIAVETRELRNEKTLLAFAMTVGKMF